MTGFTILPHNAPYPSQAMSEGLERQRQKVLASPWRPRRCAVPWTPQEAEAYNAQGLHRTDYREGPDAWPRLVAERKVDPAIAAALAQPERVVPIRTATIVRLPKSKGDFQL